jgi:hypothetical protein
LRAKKRNLCKAEQRRVKEKGLSTAEEIRGRISVERSGEERRKEKLAGVARREEDRMESRGEKERVEKSREMG